MMLKKCIAASLLLTIFVGPAAAARVNFLFTGTMQSLSDRTGWLQGAFAPGQEFSVSVSFDTSDAVSGGIYGTLASFQTTKLSVIATSGGQVLSSYNDPAAACASILSSPGCGMLEMTAYSASNPVGGDSLHYNQDGPLQFGADHKPFAGAVTGGMYVGLFNYDQTAFAAGATLTNIPDITKFWSTFSFVVYSPIASHGTPEQPVSGFGRITAVTAVPEPSVFALFSAGLACLVGSRRWRHRV